MPKVDPPTLATLHLYQRCRERHALPCQGGVLDQPEELMRAFDILDERIAVHKKKQQETADLDALKSNLRREAGFGRY